jgi:hypothetical protein
VRNKDYRSYLGAMGEALVIADLLRHGYQPHMPATNNCPYDILVTKGTIIFRVQVKYRTMTRGAVEVSMRRATSEGYKHYKDDYDILAIVTDGDRIAYLHRSELVNSVRLRIHKSKNNQEKNIRQFNKYKCINAAVIRARDQSDSRMGQESPRNKEKRRG